MAEIRNIAADQAAGTSQGVAADGNPTDDRAVRSQRCAGLHQGLFEFLLALDEGTWIGDVGKDLGPQKTSSSSSTPLYNKRCSEP